jgi:tripartite-type tricarboxylate transporter receptor subunit TctC
MVDKGLPGAALMLAMSMSTATAQNMSPIKFVVDFSAGGVTDTVARIVADDLHKPLNTVVLVEDKRRC